MSCHKSHIIEFIIEVFLRTFYSHLIAVAMPRREHGVDVLRGSRCRRSCIANFITGALTCIIVLENGCCS